MGRTGRAVPLHAGLKGTLDGTLRLALVELASGNVDLEELGGVLVLALSLCTAKVPSCSLRPSDRIVI